MIFLVIKRAVVGIFHTVLLAILIVCGAALYATYVEYVTPASQVCFEADQIEPVLGGDNIDGYTLYRVREK